MEKSFILHFFTPARHASPFDVNMAMDAGYDAVVPYIQVQLDEVVGLTQDAVFSRGPRGVKRTAIFIGGRDLELAAAMLDAARGAMAAPFQASVFVDPSGAHTTAAAMVAAVESELKKRGREGLQGLNVVVFGSTGPVGTCAAMLAASAGAAVTATSHLSQDMAEAVAQSCGRRYGIALKAARAADAQERARCLAGAHVVLACGKAGIQVLDGEDLSSARELLVGADVNAVAPAGIAGIGPHDRGAPLSAGSGNAVGIGALAIGNIKYLVQRTLFESMLDAAQPRFLDVRAAFDCARELLRA